MTARLGDLLLAAAPEAAQPPDRIAAVAARVRRQRIMTSILVATSVATVLAGAAGIMLAPPARHPTNVSGPLTPSPSIPGPAQTASGPTGSAPTGSGPTGSAPTGPEHRFSSMTEIDDAPDGSGRPSEVRVAETPDGAAVRLAYLRITAPQGDTGEVAVVDTDGRVLLQVSLANFRDYEIYLTTPAVAVGPIVVRMTCVAAGRTGTGERAGTCRAAVHLSGTLG